MKNDCFGNRAVSIWCRNMAMMLAAGTLPEEALVILVEDSAMDEAFAFGVGKMLQEMDEGACFAQAVSKSGVLPVYASQMIEAGELTGRTQSVLERLADYYDRQDQIQQRIRNTVRYPLYLLFMMCIVLAFLVWKIVPVFIGVYESLAGTLVSSSYAYIAAARYIACGALIITALLSIGLLLALIAQKHVSMHARLVRFLESFPFTKEAAWLLAVNRLLDALATYTASGLNMDEALEKSSPVVNHFRLKAAVNEGVDRMLDGENLAQIMKQYQILTPLESRMLHSGMHSGRTDEVLARLAEKTGQDADETIYRLMEGVEPLLTGFLTIAVGLALLTTMLPLVSVLSAIG